MKTHLSLVLLASLAAAGAAAATVTGDYLETRTADVYTGPCFANAEVNLAGKEAILAWRVREGSWDGARLDGLAVVAVVRASATLGDPHADPLPARSVLLVDERATAPQRRALASLARALGGDLLADVASVSAVPISASFEEGHPVASLAAGDVVDVRTRCLGSKDHHCGNEETYYPPLSAGVEARPAYALAQAFRGAGLGGTWSCPSKRSAFVGRFER